MLSFCLCTFVFQGSKNGIRQLIRFCEVHNNRGYRVRSIYVLVLEDQSSVRPRYGYFGGWPLPYRWFGGNLTAEDLLTLKTKNTTL